MTPGTPIKGKDGRVFIGATELEITDHESTGEVDEELFATSASGGFKFSVDGNKVCTGSVKGKLTGQQVISDLLQEGDLVALKLYITQAAPVTNKKLYRNIASARIKNLMMGADPNGGAAAVFSFNFTSNGTYTWAHEA